MVQREQELQLPVCEKATVIHIRLSQLNLQPSIPATGKFEALRALSIACFDFTKLDVERVVSLQCPRLQKLALEPIHYQNFVKATTKLPGCKTLRIILLSQHHEFASIVLHLLRICDGIRRLDIQLLGSEHKVSFSDCPCGLSENKSSEGIILNSLEEVNISYFRKYKDAVNLLRALLRWKFIPRRVSIHASPLVGSLSVETCKKIASFSHCDTRVEFHGWLNGSYGRHVYM
ncbi:hypothetical protein EJB05_03077, partial [Eragrostis curvula]